MKVTKVNNIRRARMAKLATLLYQGKSWYPIYMRARCPLVTHSPTSHDQSKSSVFIGRARLVHSRMNSIATTMMTRLNHHGRGRCQLKS